MLDHIDAESGPSRSRTQAELVLHLMQFCGEIIQELTQTTETPPPEAQLAESNVPADPAWCPQCRAHVSDEAAEQAHIRQEAWTLFTQRPLDAEDFVVLWLDRIVLFGQRYVLCMGATQEGYKRMLACVSSTESVESALQQLTDRGLAVDHARLCITGGQPQIDEALTAHFGPYAHLQHGHARLRNRVLSGLREEHRDTISGAIARAWHWPDFARAHAALLEVQSDLQRINRTAAQWLAVGIEPSLTLHRTGLYAHLGRSLRQTTCLHHIARQLGQQVRQWTTQWMPPAQWKACIALGLLTIEQHGRRLAHASYLAPLRSALIDATLSSTQTQS